MNVARLCCRQRAIWVSVQSGRCTRKKEKKFKLASRPQWEPTTTTTTRPSQITRHIKYMSGWQTMWPSDAQQACSHSRLWLACLHSVCHVPLTGFQSRYSRLDISFFISARGATHMVVSVFHRESQHGFNHSDVTVTTRNHRNVIRFHPALEKRNPICVTATTLSCVFRGAGFSLLCLVTVVVIRWVSHCYFSIRGRHHHCGDWTTRWPRDRRRAPEDNRGPQTPLESKWN